MKIEPNYEKKHLMAGYKLASHTATALLIGQIPLDQLPIDATRLFTC
jgi:hypothetical protein